jgi:hypothetical protein
MKDPAVFITHSSQIFDAKWITELVSAFRRRGAASAVARASDGVGDEAEVANLESSLRECDLVVVIADDRSISEPNLFFQYGAALGTGKEFVLIAPENVNAGHLPPSIPVMHVGLDALPTLVVKKIVDQTTKLWEKPKGQIGIRFHFRGIKRYHGGEYDDRELHRFTVTLEHHPIQGRMKTATVAMGLLQGLNADLVSVTEAKRVPVSGSYHPKKPRHSTRLIQFYFTALADKDDAAEISRRIESQRRSTAREKKHPYYRRRLGKKAEKDNKLKMIAESKTESDDN